MLKNQKSEIGGYILQPPAADSLIPFFDSEGRGWTSFHIFGPNEEKAKAMKIIEPLKKQFLLEEPLGCARLLKESKPK